MNELLLVVPLAPLLVALLILIFGQRLANRGSYLTVIGIALSLIALLFLVGAEPNLQGIWLETAGYQLTVGLRLDGLSRLLALLVAGVALPISVYATEYMAEESGRSRFFCVFSFFVSAMLTLVLANSLVLLFAAWEGVGVASYLLIGFWYDRTHVRRAALKAFLITRLGDLGLFLGWLWVLQILGTTDIATFLSTVDQGSIPTNQLTLLALLFFAGAISKSAQLPLTSWLPDAMAGPTPVSALIHSATMVAAGVYLVLRLFPLFAAAPGALTVVFWIGGATALFAALVATQQTDLKRVLAWSTISQLGEMMLALGLGSPLAAAYHLAAHAVFKSTLFLAAGAVGHVLHDTYSLKQLGGLRSTMPFTALTFGVAGLALAGLPPLSGFWSEEAILQQAIATHPSAGILMLVLIFLASVYISRAGVVTFGTWNGSPNPSAADPGIQTGAAMGVLGLGAIALGWLLSGRLEAQLGFTAPPEAAWGWRLVAVFGTLIGLAWGSWHALKQGAVPLLGGRLSVLERSLTAVTNSMAHLAFALADSLNKIERGLDWLVRAIATIVLTLVGANNVENAYGLNRIEQSLDGLVQFFGNATLALADTTDRIDNSGISEGVDRGSNLLSLAGQRLRQLQTGKLYLYTLAVFVWLLAVGVIGALLWR
jgi:NADH-quinone oxidoreductase subunit L